MSTSFQRVVDPRTFTRVVTPPTAEPVDLPTAKSHLRVDFSDDDTFLTYQLEAAREYIENAIGWALMTQTIVQTWDEWPWPFDQPLILARQPLQSVTSLQFIDSSGGAQTVAPANYVVDLYGDPPRIAPAFGQLWPGTALQPIVSITATYVAGYPDANSVPKQFKQAILLMLGAWYDNRSDVEVDARVRALEIPRGVADILQKFNPANVA